MRARAFRALFRATQRQSRQALLRPLDDGPRDGTETWRAIEGVVFCHWDRWLLRLSLVDAGGLAALRVRFAGHHSEEVLTLQLDDLERRLASLHKAPSEVLDAEERASEWLLRKAQRRVLVEGPHVRTKAMLATPRRILRERALRGHWHRFPISPTPFAASLATASAGEYTRASSPRFVDAMKRTLAQLTLDMGSAARLAAYRAALTVIIDAIERGASGDDVVTLSHACERAYHEELALFLDTPGLLRDFLELAIWEPYQLLHASDAFLRSLPVEHAEPAVALLHEIIDELAGDARLASARLGAEHLLEVLASAADAPSVAAAD